MVARCSYGAAGGTGGSDGCADAAGGSACLLRAAHTCLNGTAQGTQHASSMCNNLQTGDPCKLDGSELPLCVTRLPGRKLQACPLQHVNAGHTAEEGKGL